MNYKDYMYVSKRGCGCCSPERIYERFFKDKPMKSHPVMKENFKDKPMDTPPVIEDYSEDTPIYTSPVTRENSKKPELISVFKVYPDKKNTI